MRALLAAVQCDKSALTANLAMHVRSSTRRRAAGCDIAVFPEMSLTGSVDPRSHPDDAIAHRRRHGDRRWRRDRRRGGRAVRHRRAQRPRFFITQIYAQGGRASVRTANVTWAKGEEGFTPGDESALFHLGALPFGVAICAEGAVDYPFSEPARPAPGSCSSAPRPGSPAAAPTRPVSAPASSGGKAAGCADAVRHARRCGVAVALTTQAGSTRDEEFPGLAALCRPTVRSSPAFPTGTRRRSIVRSQPASPLDGPGCPTLVAICNVSVPFRNLLGCSRCRVIRLRGCRGARPLRLRLRRRSPGGRGASSPSATRGTAGSATR